MLQSSTLARRLRQTGMMAGTLAWCILFAAPLQVPAFAGDGLAGSPLYRVAVSAADPRAQQPANRITGQVDDDIAIAARGRPAGRLFLFIDGTGTSPDMAQG